MTTPSGHTTAIRAKNAGAKWTDEEVVVDDGLVSSRKPQDIPAFNREMLALFDRDRGGAARQPA